MRRVAREMSAEDIAMRFCWVKDIDVDFGTLHGGSVAIERRAINIYSLHCDPTLALDYLGTTTTTCLITLLPVLREPVIIDQAKTVWLSGEHWELATCHKRPPFCDLTI